MTTNPTAGGAGALEDDLFEFLQRKYVQRADDRQRMQGLFYTEAETHDLAKEIARFVAARASLAPGGDKIGIEKCCCGHAGCRDYWLTGIGKFNQGSGFTKEEAENIAALLNVAPAPTPPNAAVKALEEAARAMLRIAKPDWNFPGAHPAREAAIHHMETALSALTQTGDQAAVGGTEKRPKVVKVPKPTPDQQAYLDSISMRPQPYDPNIIIGSGPSPQTGDQAAVGEER